MLLDDVPTVDWTGIELVTLGSQSWSRKTLLQMLKPPQLRIEVPGIDESAVTADTPQELVRQLGRRKAQAILARADVSSATTMATATTEVEEGGGRRLVICGDAVVTHKGQILGKPRDRAEAERWLRSYGEGRPVTTVSSVTVVDMRTRACWDDIAEGEVYFRAMPDDVVDAVVRDGALQSAGGLRFEHEAVQPYVECLVGHSSAVMGFSQPLVCELIARAVAHDDGAVLL